MSNDQNRNRETTNTSSNNCNKDNSKRRVHDCLFIMDTRLVISNRIRNHVHPRKVFSGNPEFTGGELAARQNAPLLNHLSSPGAELPPIYPQRTGLRQPLKLVENCVETSDQADDLARERSRGKQPSYDNQIRTVQQGIRRKACGGPSGRSSVSFQHPLSSSSELRDN